MSAGSTSKGKVLISVSDKKGLDQLAKVCPQYLHSCCCNYGWAQAASHLLIPNLTAAIVLQGLCEQGFELVSTGGSAAALERAKLPVRRVEQLTGFPEMLDGEITLLWFPVGNATITIGV